MTLEDIGNQALSILLGVPPRRGPSIVAAGEEDGDCGGDVELQWDTS